MTSIQNKIIEIITNQNKKLGGWQWVDELLIEHKFDNNIKDELQGLVKHGVLIKSESANRYVYRFANGKGVRAKTQVGENPEPVLFSD